MRHYTTHHMSRDRANRLAPTCGAILGQHGAGAMDADEANVDCTRCLGRLELRELHELAEAARLRYGPASYATARLRELLPAMNAAAVRAGMIRVDHAERERLQLDSSGPLLQLRHRPGCPAVRTPDVCCAEVDA